MENGKFDRVGYREATQVGIATFNKGYEAFESRRTALTAILEALKDPNINKIGVYGTGGMGKTMLVKEVVAQAQKDKLFDKYPFVVVSQDPKLEKIQREIADQLDLNLDVESEPVKADLLRKRLQQEKILIVIDDIWKSLDLEALGFPFGNDKTGCKILLTSRFHNVLRNGMNTQKEFLIGVLLENEARNLFEKIVVGLTKTHEIQGTMEEIIKECGGLPIAITTVANALKNQENVNIWKDALKQLKMSSPTQIEGMHEKVYKSIKLSYKFLESNEAESLFLLCSLHGEDCNIDIDDLLRYGVGWGSFDNVYTIEDARCRVDTLVQKLKDSSLLLDGDYNGAVKMHDVIRDVAINIAVEDKHMFTIRSAIDLEDLSKWNNSTAISLPGIDIDVCELPERLECSKLQLFLLFNQKDSFKIPDSFFGGLKELRVLKIPEISPAILPSSLLSLEKLQTLCLDGQVKDVTIIGELKNLKVLTLSLSNLEQLPKRDRATLSHSVARFEKTVGKLKVIPPNVLSNLKKVRRIIYAKFCSMGD
uniref:AAA+ ATPase domain-containing protein n=1 Tax=Fagus sylvatica TaxID=28930 RepID=A0A2N9JCC7_FAGSY